MMRGGSGCVGSHWPLNHGNNPESQQRLLVGKKAGCFLPSFSFVLSASMMSSSTRSSSFPFTASQWQELEHQALIFKYMVSGMPIPPDLLYTVRRSLDTSLSSKLLLHQPQLGWNCFQLGFGRKIDPEPGRCRRTDGKKWRCSKEAYPDSKYCERHMHRGRNRSRKPVEQLISTSTNTSTTQTTTPPTAIPISAITKNNNYPYSPSSPTSHHSFSASSLTSILPNSEPPHHHYSTINHPHNTAPPPLHYPFLYPHSSSSRPPGSDFSASQDNTTTNFLLESAGPYSHASAKGFSYGEGGKEELDEHVFFSEASGTMRNISGGSSSLDDSSSWQLAPLGQLKQRSNYSGGSGNSSYLQLQSLNMLSSTTMDNNRDDQPKKVMHHFFDEWPPKDKHSSSWLDDDDTDDHHVQVSSKIQLSISMPNPSSHDFFMTRNEK
ncbi:hypothetical protein ACH5RR_006202 [Cinchona calisaya]|uniref:Growth-regulating factor n=1 Tax=Cinchona calisaya TaxID=153742 RepID=A0ABD3ANC4_9GENT